MQESEVQQAIRALVQKWMAATEQGDTEAVSDLMTDDVVVLVPGQPPMDKAAFRAAARPQSGARPRFDGVSDIKENANGLSQGPRPLAPCPRCQLAGEGLTRVT
jgi:hypothetical protein